MGQWWDSNEKWNVILAQLEYCAFLNPAGKEDITDQRPSLDGTFLFVILKKEEKRFVTTWDTYKRGTGSSLI